MRILILAIGSLISLFSFASASPTADARSAILSEERQSNAAFCRGDVAGVLADTTPDYVQILSDGKAVNKVKSSQILQAFVPSTHVKHFSEHILSFHLLNSSEAVVTNSTHAIYSLVSKTSGAHVTLDENSIDRDYWVRTSDGWRKKRSRTLSDQTKIIR